LLKPPEGELDAPPLESPFKGKTGLVRIFHAFFNSIAGLQDAWRCESAFRQEVLLAAIMIPAACLVRASMVERAMLIATVMLVIIVELLNSGVEAAIDRISFDHHSLSKRAKDIGSAAVLVALVLCALVWGMILLPTYLAA
jgi:diacylglycerol kinase (ATP)